MIPHVGTDRFAIYPDQRLRRCAGSFDAAARVTDPVAFLDHLRHKSCYRAGRARGLLARLGADLSAWFGWDVVDLLTRPDEFAKRWYAAPVTRRTLAVVLLDVARHVYDAAEHLADPDPLAPSGVVLLAGADTWCPGVRLSRFLELLDARFPKLQFVMTLSASGRRQFPTGLLHKRLPVPEAQPRPCPAPVRRLAPATVLLVDVDSTLPNLALMKLSQSFKSQGRRVVLARGVQSLPVAGTIVASRVFNTSGSAKRVEILRRRYGDAVVLGGSALSPAFVTRPRNGRPSWSAWVRCRSAADFSRRVFRSHATQTGEGGAWGPSSRSGDLGSVRAPPTVEGRPWFTAGSGNRLEEGSGKALGTPTSCGIRASRRASSTAW